MSARLPRPVSPASSVQSAARAPLALSPRARRAQAQRPELAPRLRTTSLRRHGHRERSVAAAGGEASERASPRGGWAGGSVAKMVAKQRIRMANEKHSKNITQRGNVAKTSVRKERTLLCSAAGAEVRALGPRRVLLPRPADSGGPRPRAGRTVGGRWVPELGGSGTEGRLGPECSLWEPWFGGVFLHLKRWIFLFAEKCSRREGVCRTLVIGSLHFCCLWFW